jgi:hypothetical protein
MKASEFIFESDEEFYEVRAAFGRGRSRTKPKIKFRCPSSGPRASRLVSSPAKCFSHPDVVKSQRMKKTRARTAPQQARKTKKTKKVNLASRLLRQLNRIMKR